MKEIKSLIYIDDKTVNSQREIHADLYYYQTYVVWPNGRVVPALFTSEQLSVAIKRAENQPEDILPPFRSKAPWWARLVNWLNFGPEDAA